jgi:hypothetical protein
MTRLPELLLMKLLQIICFYLDNRGIISQIRWNDLRRDLEMNNLNDKFHHSQIIASLKYLSENPSKSANRFISLIKPMKPFFETFKFSGQYATFQCKIDRALFYRPRKCDQRRDLSCFRLAETQWVTFTRYSVTKIENKGTYFM